MNAIRELVSGASKSSQENRKSKVENRKFDLLTLNPQPPTTLKVALLTAGRDRPYALGMAAALTSVGAVVDFIGSDEVASTELLQNPNVRFLNFRDQQSQASLLKKIIRVLGYYGRLVRYAVTSEARIFHILWNNKFEFFDRTLVMLYYKALGKRVVLTAHNVNAAKRDLRDSWLNRFSLRAQYCLSDHIFVHTSEMKAELGADFFVAEEKVTIVPFGINNTVPNSNISREAARQSLGLTKDDKALLFFGNIAAYKGLEYLVDALAEVLNEDRSYRLLIAGKPKHGDEYWEQIRRRIEASGVGERVIQRIEYVPDEETELYFKAADLLVLPYTRVFQSGVLFLGYSFGLPVAVADVATLKDEIVEGETGFVFQSESTADLAQKMRDYFKSDLFLDLESRRERIREYANDRYSWDNIASKIRTVYLNLLKN